MLYNSAAPGHIHASQVGKKHCESDRPDFRSTMLFQAMHIKKTTMWGSHPCSDITSICKLPCKPRVRSSDRLSTSCICCGSAPMMHLCLHQ